jgi:hypothetical protein
MTLIWIGLGLVALILINALVRLNHDARLRRAGLLPPRGRATMSDVERLLQSGHRILAIRCYREVHGVGLKDAKAAVDKMSERNFA